MIKVGDDKIKISLVSEQDFLYHASCKGKFRSLGEVLSSTLNLPGCFHHFFYEYELKNVMLTLSKEGFILPKNKEIQSDL